MQRFSLLGFNAYHRKAFQHESIALAIDSHATLASCPLEATSPAIDSRTQRANSSAAG